MNQVLASHEQRIRRLAKRYDCVVVKSRGQLHFDNHGAYQLINTHLNVAVLGARYDASLEEIETYLIGDGTVEP